jgi:N-acetylglucosaminyldiphosphoundecaprenol N-acetyl-beta-D-mannosaminyltransferase
MSQIPSQDPPRKDFLGLYLLALTTEQFVHWILGAADCARSQPEPAFVTYLNAACVNIAASDQSYATILRGADGVYADGKAIVWASHWLGQPLPERVNAADFVIPFCRAARDHGKKVYLLGAPPDVAQAAACRFREEVPGLQIVGSESGYFAGEEESVIGRIASAAPDILLIGMGVPLQEKWAWQNRHRLNTRVIWCVGAMFEFYGNYRPRAPQWMCKAGLEWLFRLMIEPRRMWKRYLLGNVQFLWRVARRKPIQ